MVSRVLATPIRATPCAYPRRRSGLIPLDNTSDVAGPLARSVEDAARVFGVLAGFDARDPLTQFALNASLPANYTQFLDAGGLKVSPRRKRKADAVCAERLAARQLHAVLGRWGAEGEFLSNPPKKILS